MVMGLWGSIMVFIGVSFFDQSMIKALVLIEFMYLMLFGLAWKYQLISGWFLLLIMVFSSLEGVLSLSLLMSLSKYNMSLGNYSLNVW